MIDDARPAHYTANTPVTPEARCHCGACTAQTAAAPPLSPWFHSSSVIDRRSTAENCHNRGPSRWHGGNFEHVPPCLRSTSPVTPEARCYGGACTA